MDLSNGLEDVPVSIEGSSGVLTFPEFQVSSLLLLHWGFADALAM